MNTETKVEATPGPWEEGIMQIMDREDDDNYRFIKAGEGYWSRTKKNTGFWLTGYISPADSRMISAAPDMLEALQQVIRHGLIEQDGYETVLKMVHSAISKAKGE